jgi:hypothetical protein
MTDLSNEEAAPVEEAVIEESALGMSDEEWAESSAALLSPEEIVEPVIEAAAEEDPSIEPKEEIADEEPKEDGSPKGAESDGEISEAEEEEDPENSEDPKEEGADDDKEKGGDDAVDFEAAYKRITAPFKANGKEMQVTNVDDALQLMQMGANYNKKMAALKPSLKIMKLLENNNLLDESKLGYLIDLDKKNPEAITKLLKDSGMNPMDVDIEKDSNYKASDYSVDDRELELDTVLGDIKDSDTYNQTLEIVSKKWDGSSKQTVANNPQLLKVINDHLASGVYEVISKDVEKERMLGRLDGLSDIEAYQKVGDSIQERGGFDHLFKPEQSQEPAPKEAPKKRKPNPELDKKRRAASPTKPSAPASKAPADFNPLAMSDDAYEAQVNAKFL